MMIGADVITTVAMLAPEWVLFTAIVLVGVYLVRRVRQRSNSR